MDNREIIDSIRRRRQPHLPYVMGSLVGGAVGDALGYPVEFMSYASIQAQFGAQGIRSYWLDRTGGVALFSDDTQMTLFTAAGLLEAVTCDPVGLSREVVANHVYRAYLDWLHTQDHLFVSNPGASQLVDVPELQHRRAPGNTCLSALYSGQMGTIEAPLNNSCGCGGVMRVAPVGLLGDDGILRRAWAYAADVAAITHGHPMGYIPAAALAQLVSLLVMDRSQGASLERAVSSVIEGLPRWFADQREHADDMASQLRRAAALAAGVEPDYDCVVQLGEGWVGDEALAIAVFCCLRHPDSFDEAVIAAVNHGGDSDSTGAVAGNIMGAYLGIDAIGPHWTEHLELRGLIEGLARDLCEGCLGVDERGWCNDAAWLDRWARHPIGSLAVVRGNS